MPNIHPADYPPPFADSDYVERPAAGEDERIEVGVLIVGGGPGGMATAIRLGQLLAEDEALTEALGEVPIALADKGKAPGSHLLSGAVMKPGPIKKLFRDTDPASIPHYWEVDKERVYFMTKFRALRIPPPPQMRNHGNWVVSVSQMARWMSEQAEEYGVYLLPETDCQKVLIDQGRVMGVVTGDKGRGKAGEELPTFEPGMELHAQVTVFAEGTPGHLSQVTRKHFELDQNSVQTWELGVKEIWEVPKPLEALVHTAGWPLRLNPKHREYGGSWLYPMGDNMVSLGFVVGLDYADATLSVHDILQDFKQHPLVHGILDGGKRIAWGAKTIPGSGLYGLPGRLHVPGALFVGDSAGFVDMAALKGVNYAIQSGMLAAEAIYEALKAKTATTATGLWGYDQRIRNSSLWHDLWKVRNIRPGFQRGMLVGGMIHGMATASGGRMPKVVTPIRDAKEPVYIGNRRYMKPDGKLTFDKLSSVFASGNKTRDDQPNHIRVQTDVPVELGVAWENMCPAQVYEVDMDTLKDGRVTVRLNPSNCVQCGAITAKGGRLTPPEGGSGPEYTLT
ncbi:MAG: 4Fe-4S dicluster domain-containing protein [Thermoleophilia bacterium]